MRAYLIAAACLASCATPPPEPTPATRPVVPNERIDGTRASGTVASPADLSADGVDAASLGVEPDAMPLVRIPPSGFERCIMHAAAGSVASVTLMFDVTAEGRTANIRVTDATDPCYERYTIRAAEKWRYAIVDGQAVPRRGVTTVMRFQTG